MTTDRKNSILKKLAWAYECLLAISVLGLVIVMWATVAH